MADGETVIDVMKVEELKNELKKLKLRCTGNKDELRERLRIALCREGDDKDEDDEEESDIDEDDDGEDAGDEWREHRGRENQLLKRYHSRMSKIRCSRLMVIPVKACGNGWRSSRKPLKYADGPNRVK